MVSPPKPWETTSSIPPASTSTVTTEQQPPAIPDRPPMTSFGYGMNTMNSMNPMSYGGYNSYSPYNNRYGGYGGYNRMGMYSGGYGGGYGYNSGYNSYGYNRPMGGELSSQVEQSTQATFQMLDQIVQAFGGFAQMLESTFFATQSSFMAMVGVAEQFGHLRNYLSQIFSVVSLYETVKGYYSRNSISVNDFVNKKPPVNRRPLWIFLALVIGLPYLVSKVVARKAIDPAHLSPEQIKDLEFAKAIYEYRSNTPGDLSFGTGEIIAILQKVDQHWWRGRTQAGQVGLFPANRVEIVQKKPITDQ